MLINPRTIRMSQMDLSEIYNAARKRLDQLTPGSPKYRSLEWALFGLADALEAAEKAAQEKLT